jgi:hypothetical protein
VVKIHYLLCPKQLAKMVPNPTLVNIREAIKFRKWVFTKVVSNKGKL